MPLGLHQFKDLERRPRLKATCLQLQDLANGLGPGAKMPKVAEVRAQLGVSIQTLNDAVRVLEAHNVLRTVHGVGIYVASHETPPLVGTIGFITSAELHLALDIAYWGMLLTGINKEAARQKQQVLLINDVKAFTGWEKIDGAIVSSFGERKDPTLYLRNVPKSVPYVSVIDALPGIPGALADDYQGTYLVTRHLIELGHRRIGYLAQFAERHSVLAQRRKGYRAALKEAGISGNESWERDIGVLEGWSTSEDNYLKGGRYSTERWLEQGWAETGCTALVCQNDVTAVGAISAFSEAGLQVPRDVSVVGFDHTTLQSSFSQQLTSVHIPLLEIGETAVKLMCELLKNPSQVLRSVSLPVSLVEGETSAPPPDGA